MATQKWGDGYAEEKRRAKPDPELAAMRRILAILEELAPGARRRVAAFVISRTAGDIVEGLRITDAGVE
jgi:hypothetical protein